MSYTNLADGLAEAGVKFDVVYEISDENIKETWPNEGFASEFSREILVKERSLTLGTQEGEIDVLDRIDGIGDYASVLIISLSGLIASKRASNRDKDRFHLVELEAIEEIR